MRFDNRIEREENRRERERERGVVDARSLYHQKLRGKNTMKPVFGKIRNWDQSKFQIS